MTWVIGMPGLLNGGAAIADIRIAVLNGRGGRRAVEGVQKIHQVGRWMILGFAGNVEVGFRAVNDLRHYLSEVPTDVVRPGSEAQEVHLPA